MIDIGCKVEIVDLKDYPDFGLRVGQTGDVVSIFKYEGHHVAQFAPDDQRGLKFNKDCKTYPLSLSRIAKVMALLIAMLMHSFAYAQPIIIGGTATDLEVLEARKLVRAADNAAGTLTVGSQFTTSEVDNARKLLQAIEPKKLEIKVGEFEAIEPAKSVTSPLLWVSMDDTIVERIAIPKGQPCAIWMTRRGDAAPKLHLFEAKPFDWAILVGKKNGASTIQIIRNGDDATKPPVVIDRIDMTVGKPEPKPVDPPVDPPAEDRLVKTFREAAQQDAAANKSDKKHLLALSRVYKKVSEDTLEALKTMSDLDSRLLAERIAASIPDPETVFPALRKAVQSELYQQLGINKDSGAVELKIDTRRLARSVMARIAVALEEVAK